MSTVIGEIRADDFEPSLQLLPKTTGYNYNKYLIDLPTRLTKAKILDNHSIWKGTLPPYVVHGREYTKSETLTLSSLPFTSQPVVEGILCLASNYDPQGHTCDLAAIDLILPEEMKQRNEPVRPTESNAVPEEDSKECPVCKYMKVNYSFHSYQIFSSINLSEFHCLCVSREDRANRSSKNGRIA